MIMRFNVTRYIFGIIFTGFMTLINQIKSPMLPINVRWRNAMQIPRLVLPMTKRFDRNCTRKHVYSIIQSDKHLCITVEMHMLLHSTSWNYPHINRSCIITQGSQLKSNQHGVPLGHPRRFEIMLIDNWVQPSGCIGSRQVDVYPVTNMPYVLP